MQVTCARGHIYESNQYAACPYCNRDMQAIYFRTNGEVNPQMAGGTPAPVPQQNIQKTVAPGMNGGAANNGAIGKTEAPEYLKERMKKEEKNRTVGIFQKKFGMDPVVGWLVCIEGPGKGKDYRLYDCINTIGRAAGNTVVLEQEQTVSQKNHARIAYDPKHNDFQVIPGEGHNITYVNDVPLYVPQPLEAYDVLELGETKLIFVPLCSERFQWKQVEQE